MGIPSRYSLRYSQFSEKFWKMKISAALVPFILAQTEAGKGKSDVCQACDGKFKIFKFLKIIKGDKNTPLFLILI